MADRKSTKGGVRAAAVPKRPVRKTPVLATRNGAGVTDAELDQLLAALNAARDGDFSVRLSGRKHGVMGEIGRAFNGLVALNEHRTDEVSRVARMIGREGRTEERLRYGVGKGAWHTNLEALNTLIDDLVRSTTEVARVISAVADGDLGQKVVLSIDGRPLRGDFLRIARTVNGMVDQLSSFADEVTRVAREVGTEGRLGGQAKVKGVSGTWKGLTDSVNDMANNLTTQVRNIAQVTTAVAMGDLSQKITVDVRGEILELKNTINAMVDSLRTFSGEVTRVAREVGTEGRLGGQAQVEGVAGVWKDLTENVNGMATNLTTQVRGISKVVTAVANGDLDQKLALETKGEVAELTDTINSMIDNLRSFSGEVTRVAREVGTEGVLGGQAQVEGVAGVWKGLTENVNWMANNLTNQVRNIAQVTTAVANGDLSQKITVDVKGEVLELKNTVNDMVDKLQIFAGEVTRVAREVGTEGALGGQAEVTGVSGTWQELTDNVNRMANNLTAQVRDIAQVTTAVAQGDLSRKITVDVKGEVLALKNTINAMVDRLSSFADEVTRVAREVGTEGVLGGQAEVEGAAGRWKELTDNVNGMASNLTSQVRNIAHVSTAVAQGDLSQKITVEAKGEVAALADTLNSMVDTLRSFAGEVTRVAREVGTEGKLGGQAAVEGVAGTWKDLTDNVNFMASNLTAQVRDIAQVTTAVAKGDLTQKITVDVKGEILELKSTINTMVDQLSAFADEVTRVAREVGTEGRLGGQAQVRGVAGTWKDLTDNVNGMANNLTGQVRNIAAVTTAVANGDLSRKITVDVKGEVLELKDTINAMVDRLDSFAAEVTRVAREVGTEGVLGGQADVRGVSGVWKDLTDNVNGMASNLTSQVRNIAQVTTAVANGDLSQKITVEARGEILELKNTINLMVDQLSAFASEVTRVAQEVGTEGILGGQAEVEGVSGTWRRLTENVNLLAANLTSQVRSIAETSAAVIQGDFTREITVDVKGEIAELKDTINQMIANLAATTTANQEQDWLKTNLARITSLMQGQRDLAAVARMIMSEVTPVVSAQHGAFFLASPNGAEEESPMLRLIASYAYKQRKNISNQFKLGEGMVGQAALEKKRILVTQAPADYIKIASGLGESEPINIIVIPVLFEENVLAVIELASFRPFGAVGQDFLEQLTETLGIVLNTISQTMRTEELLGQSQSLASELQSQSEELQTQQEELQQRNEELEEKAGLLAQQNRDIEIKNREIAQQSTELERRAEELAISSRYKSEFLANMSHELRTPLNSLLILSKLLQDNPEGTLSDKQLEFAATIHQSGSDLLALIEEILDLSKIEAGKMDVSPTKIVLADVRDFVDRTFRPLAEQKGLGLETKVDRGVPKTIVTDEQRLQQVLKNLISNAIKFTIEGNVALTIKVPARNTSFLSAELKQATQVVAFEVADTGVGIPADKLALIFEAFQQADGTTSRRFGGTGLGLSISREIARLLGGEVRVESTPEKGSLFTLYLPVKYAPPAERQPTDEPKDDSDVKEDAPPSAPPIVVPAPETTDPALLKESEVADDRAEITPGDRVFLAIEDDPGFAKAVLENGRSHGFKGLVALRADTGLALAHEYRPDAILLDLKLTGGVDGFAVLDHLKSHADTRHIPVSVVSGMERRHEALKGGAVAFYEKPLTEEQLAHVFEGTTTFLEKKVRRLLVVEDDEGERRAIAELIGTEGDVSITGVGSSADALKQLESTSFECMVLDLKLPDMSGFELLEKIKKDERLGDVPVIVYTGADLTRQEETKLRKHAEAIIVKDVRSPERLLDETSLYLHRPTAKLPKAKQKMLDELHRGDAAFEGKKILIVDDDVRNVFALTSVLESRGMEVLFAENGKEGLDVLKRNEETDLVLMDIMMPEMDGYETMKRLRKLRKFERLPVISLTAKAMPGDREKSITAGASDYITKPVDTEQLLSLMRVWLYR